jgi:hypothetical protein
MSVDIGNIDSHKEGIILIEMVNRIIVTARKHTEKHGAFVKRAPNIKYLYLSKDYLKTVQDFRITYKSMTFHTVCLIVSLDL